MMKKVANYFMQGVLVLAPMALTLYVCYVVFVTIDGLLNIPIPGLGFLLTVAFITLIGFLASAFITRRMVLYVEDLMNRLPLVRLLYSSIRDLLNAFVGEKRRFNKPVLVAFMQGSPARVFGFVTQESLERLDRAEHVAVYVPQSYNFAGNLVVVPRANVEVLEADASSVMAFIVSGGVTDVPGRAAPTSR